MTCSTFQTRTSPAVAEFSRLYGIMCPACYARHEADELRERAERRVMAEMEQRCWDQIESLERCA